MVPVKQAGSSSLKRMVADVISSIRRLKGCHPYLKKNTVYTQ